MFSKVFNRPHVLSRLKTNPISSHLRNLVTHLLSQVYSIGTVQQYIMAAEHFGKWMSVQYANSKDGIESQIEVFIQVHLGQCTCQRPASRGLVNVRAALFHLLKVIPPASVRSGNPLKELDPFDEIVWEFLSYLRKTCGLAEASCLYRERYAREFLNARFKTGIICWKSINPQDIMSFVSNYGMKRRPSSVNVAAGSLRSFFRFLQLYGHCGPELAAAVPHIPRWSLSQLPKTMTEQQVSQFIECFDIMTKIGKRDFAAALCQLELGLRVSEVAAIRLDDIDWRRAILRIRAGKTNRIRELPLSQRLGKSLANYIHKGRPITQSRVVFVRHTGPRGNPAGVSLIRGAIRRAYFKVPGGEKWTGTHILRHTAATRMHRKGASLKEVGDILGHQSIDTTAIYAKVDLPTLSAVALPWPGVTS